MEKNPNTISIKELHKSALISSRAYNLCDLHLIITLEDLSKYINKHKAFLNLKRCGKKNKQGIIKTQ